MATEDKNDIYILTNAVSSENEEPRLEHNDDPYILDYIVKGETRIPALTNKNSRFFEGILSLDSNYSKDIKVNEKPDDGFDPEANPKTNGSKYGGSIAYWFDQIKHHINDEAGFKKAVLGAIIAIDRADSTHLEASVDGRKKMRDIICDICKCENDLISELKEPLPAADKEKLNNHLLARLSQKMDSTSKNNVRYNLSFASKFCSYAYQHLVAEKQQYSKYDNVVADALPEYVWMYLNEKQKKGAYKPTYSKNTDAFTERLKIYKKYSDDIEKLLVKVAEQDQDLDRDKLDHIIWYGYKGK